MNIQSLFGNTPFEKAQEGIAKRVMINGALMATLELMKVYKDIDNATEIVKDNIAEDPMFMADGLLEQARIDETTADVEIIALSNMLEKHMGISA